MCVGGLPFKGGLQCRLCSFGRIKLRLRGSDINPTAAAGSAIVEVPPMATGGRYRHVKRNTCNVKNWSRVIYAIISHFKPLSL